jgi:hypothetical protein
MNKTELAQLKKQAAEGDLVSLNDLGFYYDEVEHDLPKAIECFRKGLLLYSCDCLNAECGVSMLKSNLACKLYQIGKKDEG